MPVQVVPRKQTIEDAPFTFVITKVDMPTEDGRVIYLVDVLVDDYFICGDSFDIFTGDFETNWQAALPGVKATALAKVAELRRQIADMQAIVDKVANHAD